MNDNATMEQLNSSLDIAVASGAVHVCRLHANPSYYPGSRSAQAAFDYYDKHRANFDGLYESDAQALRFLGGAISFVIGTRPVGDCYECNEGAHPFPVN